MSRNGRSLHRRTTALEEQAGPPKGEDVVFELHFRQPLAESVGGGVKVRVESVPGGTGIPDRYYFQPSGAEEGEEEALTRDEFDALPPARHTLPEGHPDHQLRRHPS